MMKAVRRGVRREEGASLVEFALIAPILLVLLFGIIEYGIAFSDKLTVDNAVQTGARVGAAIGNDEDVDLFILNAVNQGVSNLSGGGSDLVERVEIFEVDANGNPVSGNVNVYYVWNNDGPSGGNCDWYPCPEGSTGYTGWAWAPDDRSVEVGDLDVLGVRIYYAHNWITGGLVPLPDSACDDAGSPGDPSGLASSTNCWVEESIMRLEPLQFAQEEG